MTDIVKELYKGEVLAGNYVSGIQTLYTTDSTKTAVIKDVDIGTSAYSTAPTLQAGDFDVVSLSAPATGSEIIGTNSTIKIKNNQSFSNYRALSAEYITDTSVSSVQFFPATNPSSIFTPITPALSVTKGSATTVAGGALTGTTTVYWAYEIGGFVYYYNYNGNDGTSFYYRNISTGANTTVSTTSYAPIAFDGVNKFYYVNGSGQIVMFSATTNTSTTIASPGWAAGSTYAQIWIINNVIFWKNTWSTSTMTFYNTTTGATGSVFTVPSGLYSSEAYATAGFYDSSTFTYTLVFANGKNVNSFNYLDIVSNAAGSSFTSGSKITSNITLNAVAKNFAITPMTPAGSTLYSFGSTSDTTNNKIYSMNKAGVLTEVATVTDQTFTAYSSGMVSLSTPTNSDLNTYGPKISLRITGVESTL